MNDQLDEGDQRERDAAGQETAEEVERSAAGHWPPCLTRPRVGCQRRKYADVGSAAVVRPRSTVFEWSILKIFSSTLLRDVPNAIPTRCHASRSLPRP